MKIKWVKFWYITIAVRFALVCKSRATVARLVWWFACYCAISKCFHIWFCMDNTLGTKVCKWNWCCRCLPLENKPLPLLNEWLSQFIVRMLQDSFSFWTCSHFTFYNTFAHLPYVLHLTTRFKRWLNGVLETFHSYTKPGRKKIGLNWAWSFKTAIFARIEQEQNRELIVKKLIFHDAYQNCLLLTQHRKPNSKIAHVGINVNVLTYIQTWYTNF